MKPVVCRLHVTVHWHTVASHLPPVLIHVYVLERSCGMEVTGLLAITNSLCPSSDGAWMDMEHNMTFICQFWCWVYEHPFFQYLFIYLKGRVTEREGMKKKKKSSILWLTSQITKITAGPRWSQAPRGSKHLGYILALSQEQLQRAGLQTEQLGLELVCIQDGDVTEAA